jgi:hypothetical protein
MTVKGSPDGLGRRLAELPWVTHVTVTQENRASRWQINVSQAGIAETNLLRYILSDQGVIVTEFNRKKYELEEVFMEIVKGDGNDS